jgi:hypothetical protein
MMRHVDEFSAGVTLVMIKVREAVHSLPYRNSCHYHKDDKLCWEMSPGAIKKERPLKSGVQSTMESRILFWKHFKAQSPWLAGYSYLSKCRNVLQKCSLYRELNITPTQFLLLPNSYHALYIPKWNFV